jgi:hypothetical protein
MSDVRVVCTIKKSNYIFAFPLGPLNKRRGVSERE